MESHKKTKGEIVRPHPKNLIEALNKQAKSIESNKHLSPKEKTKLLAGINEQIKFHKKTSKHGSVVHPSNSKH